MWSHLKDCWTGAVFEGRGSRRWCNWLLDSALVVLAAMLWLTDEVVIAFHLMFVALTLAAFSMPFRSFVWRLSTWSLIIAAAVDHGVGEGSLHPYESVEVPLLAIITLVIFGIARSRAQTSAHRWLRTRLWRV